MENNLVFQPYGKDELYVNFLATIEGEWYFGPCDVENFEKLNKKSVIHTFIKLKCVNPKYLRHATAKEFVLKKETKIIKNKHKRKLTDINELYVFILFDSDENFLFMEYTPDYEEYMFVKENFNMLSSFIIIADSLSIVKEHLGTAIGAPKEIIMQAIGEMKDEID